MKKIINNPGRRTRTKEEMEARREARRRYYEELEAFERDLPDFIFADKEDNNIEANEESELPKEPETSEEPEVPEIPEEPEVFELPADESDEDAEKGSVGEDAQDSIDTAADGDTGASADDDTETGSGAAAVNKTDVEDKTDADTEDAPVISVPEKIKKKKSKRPEKPGQAGKKRGSGKRSTSIRGKRRRRRNYLPLVTAAACVLLLFGGALFALNSLGIIGGKKLYEVYINDTLVGKVEDPDTARDTYLEIRREVVSSSVDPVLMEADYDVKRVETFTKIPSGEAELQENIRQALEESVVGTLEKSYTVKINDYIVNLEDKNEVVELLETVKGPYDANNEYSVQLVADISRELSVLTTQVVKTEESEDIAGMVNQENMTEETAAELTEEEPEEETTLPESTGENDGLKSVGFVETVEIAESYVSAENIVTAEEAAAEITKEKEENKVYEVVSGDCLSIVASKNDMTVARLLELNEHMSEDTVLQIGDEVVVTVPQPELSVITQEEISYEEDYEAAVQYIDNDSWYTTKQVVKQEPVTGHHKVTALVTYKNGKETEREIIAETVISAAVPKIVERGTQTPPTYIKPLSGGTFTSGFKYRWGRWHKGVDWACPVGTAIWASCGGTVTSAGWSSGYGYCITLRHPDGRQTRYAHLSKILVSAGQSVKQGQKIALSGNTGRSTGPHLHFEIIINGSQVNPLKYLN